MVTTQEIKDENKEMACNVKDNRLIMARYYIFFYYYIYVH